MLCFVGKAALLLVPLRLAEVGRLVGASLEPGKDAP